MRKGGFLAMAAATGMVWAGTAPAAASGWPDTPSGRARMLAAIQELEITLLTHPSATRALEEWCATHRMADRPVVVAHKVAGNSPETVPERVRTDLAVTATQAIRHRQVQLVCGAHVLSVADNWYVPDRLTAQMNDALDQTDMPFGHVVAPLHFSRERLEFVRLWSPSDEKPPVAADAMIVPPAIILRQRAVLRDAHGLPFSEVVETYTSQTLDFTPAPQTPPTR
ncbi:hypothetical protein [Komagataeibacter saccharivorans]